MSRFNNDPYKRCQSKAVSIGVKPREGYDGLDEVEVTATLHCPKSVLGGELTARQYGHTNNTNQLQQTGTDSLRSLANTAMCDGCPYVDLSPTEAYDLAQQAARSRNKLHDMVNEQDTTLPTGNGLPKPSSHVPRYPELRQ